MSKYPYIGVRDYSEDERVCILFADENEGTVIFNTLKEDNPRLRIGVHGDYDESLYENRPQFGVTLEND